MMTTGPQRSQFCKDGFGTISYDLIKLLFHKIDVCQTVLSTLSYCSSKVY